MTENAATTIDLDILLRMAVEKATGVRALGRMLQWHPGAIMNVKNGEKMSPYRAVQLAQLVDVPPLDALLTALENAARTEHERQHWRSFALRLRIDSACKKGD